ncbi:unnamed protein product [Durusdinium trenchii]|uniref:Uncharacterized protein n=1 Tax=Durusdinium trenchii TaxID=1381693 RepID=A0ABP0MZH6_9DINO
MATEKQDQAPQDEEIDEESDGESVEIKDGSCGGCDQEFGAQDEAEGVSLQVVSAKGDNKAICRPCFYIHRGSLGKVKLRALFKLLRKSPALRKKFPRQNLQLFLSDSGTIPRFRSLRRNYVRRTAANPKAKPRHEVLDIKHYVQKRQSKYIDFYQERADWQELDSYFREHAPQDVKKKVKTAAAKRNWITNVTWQSMLQPLG